MTLTMAAILAAQLNVSPVIGAGTADWYIEFLGNRITSRVYPNLDVATCINRTDPRGDATISTCMSVAQNGRVLVCFDAPGYDHDFPNCYVLNQQKDKRK